MGVAEDLADIIYRIDPQEAVAIAAGEGPRPLTEAEREKIVRLFLRKRWRRLRRFARQLDRWRAPVSAGDRLLSEWLVHELYGSPTDQPDGFTAENGS
jgi:hypothetical protein